MADAVGETIDRISSLPDYILLLIVYFLPLDDTLQIRFLSTRFRNLSRSISNIFICRDNPVRPDQSEEFKEKAWTNHEQWTRARKCRLRCFEEFMEKALSNHEQLTRVQKFLLRCSNNDYKSATISNWIHSAITASVSNLVEIDIYAHENLRVKFPRSFFSCRKLRFLRLSGVISVNKIPKGMVFPCLKTLELESISIVSNDNQLNNLLSIGCPVLEYSLLRDFSLNYSWTCPAQRFRYLRGTWVRGDCPNNLSKRILKHLELYDNDMFDIVTFMGRVGNRPIFEHLTHVVVEVGPETPFLGLRDLLKHSPNLTSLELKKASLGHLY
ncbi:hypothetical protein PTKIN_Ptkin11bG0172100 [Pterospermum kingtungense]